MSKSTPSVTSSQLVKLLSSIFINEFLIVLFCLSTRPFACGWYALITRWMIPVKRCNSAETLLTNSRTWSFIWMKKQPCLNIIWYKNCEIVVAFLIGLTGLTSLTGFASNYSLKLSMHTIKQQYPLTLGKLQISTSIWFITAIGTGILCS